jgi:pSer/pThr/pTyr-binding forkhead associated (FHA) protein/predicted Ser/Thr protein kinase
MANEQLRVRKGEERGRRLSVDAELLIGRVAPEEEGRLGGDAEISRRHAHVSRAPDGRLSIEDLGSANGTFVNDERIGAPRMLDLGDVVRMGKTVLQVTDRSGAVPANVETSVGAPVAEAAAAAEAGEVLVVSAGQALGRRLTAGEELVIGRSVSGDGGLPDDLELSRRHARVARESSGELSIEDLGSANGTFVNGERVRGRRTLKVGDSIRVGTTTMELTDPGRVAAPAVPAAPPPPPAPAPPAAAAPPAAPAQRSPARVVPDAVLREPAPELSLGSVFAGCRVEGVIGQGDMGVVYRAEELALKRPVALKLIRPEYSQEERLRERFRRESKIAAAIDHPNVIPIFDAGDEDGVLFIMMRLVEGTDLRELIAADGKVEPLRAARIVRQVGAALDAAHARGMLHRDVKPSNVLLARADHVYLSDFGLAKHAAQGGGLTRQGSIVARADYVAPEQVLNQPVDERADIYALGCLLFEALTGEAPFASWQGGPAALAHVDAPPPSPSDLRPELPREFDEVVHRAMAKDPSERYSSAGDLGRAALRAAGGPGQASPSSVLATGQAAPVGEEQAAELLDESPRTPLSHRAPSRRLEVLQWAIALAGLLVVAAGMVAALNGISNL